MQEQKWTIKDDEIYFPPYQGEMGWEIATIVPYYRYVAQKFNKAYVTSFPGMEALYEDFAEFKSHGSNNRTLNYPKRYRLYKEAIYKKYGNAIWYQEEPAWFIDSPGTFKKLAKIPSFLTNIKKDDFGSNFAILIHSRGIKRKASINFNRWEKIIKYFTGLKIASIGTLEDMHVPYTIDGRGINLHDLMNYMAGCKCVVGVSSGVMHLAAFCGAPIVVWGDNRTYYWETLETRYKKTWNPFGNEVFYMKTENFQPNIDTIIKGISNFV